MSFRNKKIVIALGFIVVVIIGPLTVLLNSGLESTNQLIFINSLLRMFGLLAFSMLFVQVVLGSNMTWFSNIVGAKAYKYHILLAFMVVFLIVLHPLAYSLTLATNTGLIGLLSTFLPSKPFGPDEIYISLGRISFVVLVLVFIAGYFRTKPILRRNWKKVHVASFVAFFTIAVHSWNIGSDIRSSPFVWFYYLAVASVVSVTIRDIYYYFKSQ